MNEIVISGDYTQTSDNKPFLKFDNHEETRRMVLFMSDIGIEIMSTAEKWHVDGTFSRCPKFLKQLLTIHAEFKDE